MWIKGVGRTGPAETAGAEPGQAWIVCQWCQSQSPEGTRTCLSCGAALDQRDRVAMSGWREAPRVADLTEFRFASSTCQIAGQTVPVADIALAAGDAIYLRAHSLLWHDAEVQLEPLASGEASEHAEALGLVVVARGPGQLAVSHDTAGELVVLPLAPKTRLQARMGTFVLASGSVRYGLVGFMGELTTTDLWYLDSFVTTEREGLLVLHGAGAVFERRLADGETITIRPSGFLYREPTVGAELVRQATRKSRFKEKYLYLVTMTGPGRVGIQSMAALPADPEQRQKGWLPS